MFRTYTAADREACLAIFDANCPDFFAPNERADYAAFLDQVPPDYEVCVPDGAIAGAFGLLPSGAPDRAAINWIMLSPDAQGQGVGRAIIVHIAEKAAARGITTIDIAASHRSASFFARFGAVEQTCTRDGWGPGMHRVDMIWRPDS